MDLELRQLRCLVAIVDAGTFTDAAADLGVSQAAVSRNLQALERLLGVRLLHRTSRSVALTTAGVHVLAQARQLLAAADNLVTEATTGHTVLRVGHAWAALGRHTGEFLRRWAAGQPAVSLNLVRVNSPTGGLAEGLVDIAVLRTAVADGGYDSAVVGQERRYCALAADDPWARRRSIRLSEVAGRTVVYDQRTGTTTAELWPPGGRPRLRDTRDVDDWLAVIAAGEAVGITPEATTVQYRRDGIVFRPLRDAPPIDVRVIWRRHDPHPATAAAVALLTELYRRTTFSGAAEISHRVLSSGPS
ncbi:MAG TPA: LysR family transcriptional regulator [Trebonia sp.]|jgi:DNA-binding transcriptional LysR family regulator|nr:LysR family transcriptional regulator [Trebonia sp.]